MDVIQTIYGNLSNALTANVAASAVSVLVVLVLYLGWTFFGYKAMRVFSAIFGFAFGLLVGFVVVNVAGLKDYWMMIVPAGCAVLFTALGFFIYKVGLFLMEVSLIFGALYPILQQYVTLDTRILAAIAGAAALLIAILSMIFFRPAIIVASALSGGIGFSTVLFTRLVHIKWNTRISMIATFGAALVIAVIGMIYQFRTTRRR